MKKEKNIRIDYTKYEVDEVAETIADAILFPLYIGKVLLMVIGCFAAFLIFLAYSYTNYFITGFLFFVLSYAISLPSIVLVSGIRLIYTIRDDINKVFEICVDTTKHIYNDSQLLREQRKSGLPISATFKDVFRGVAIYVIRPSLKKVLAKRIKFMAGPFIFLIDQVFKLVVIRKQPEFNVTEIDNEEISVETGTKSLDDKVKSGGSKMTNVTMGVITFPLYVVLAVYGSVNFLLVWLLSWIFS